MDENCLIFDLDAETSKERRETFERYKKLVDGLLEAFCIDAKITVDEVIQGIGRLNIQRAVKLVCVCVCACVCVCVCIDLDTTRLRPC